MSEKINYLRNKQKAHEVFLGGVKRIGIPKYVDPGYQPTQAELLGERLKTYPEMDEFWEVLFEWDFEREPRMPNRFALLPQSIVDFGLAYLQPRTLPDTVSSTQRKSTASRIAKNAKLLEREVSKMGLPESVFFYLPREYVQRLLRDFVVELGLALSDVEFSSLAWDDDPIEKTTDEQETHQVLNMAIAEYTMKLSLSHPFCNYDSEPAFGISGILKSLTDENAVIDRLPDVTVKRSTPQTKMRLALIRQLSRWMYQTHHQNPILHRKVIAAVARAILDDREVGEDTVKDSLRGFDFRSRRQGISRPKYLA